VRSYCAGSYKQTKFNLMREQSEGYSKLVTEITASLGPAHDDATGRSLESSAELRARALPAWERIVSLVGYFDLDPNRALDILIDVFSVNVAIHWAFFLELLNCSPWGICGLDGRPLSADRMQADQAPPSYGGKDLDEILAMSEAHAGVAEVKPSGTGEGVLAQILGFKFGYYQVRAACTSMCAAAQDKTRAACRGRRAYPENPVFHGCSSHS
jgi:THO complex subunit 2